MSFDDAIPLNRGAYGRPNRYDPPSDGRGARQQGMSGDRGPRQSVNISEDTLLRMARTRLSRTMHRKLAYSPTGQFAPEPTVGQLLSTRA